MRLEGFQRACELQTRPQASSIENFSSIVALSCVMLRAGMLPGNSLATAADPHLMHADAVVSMLR